MSKVVGKTSRGIIDLISHKRRSTSRHIPVQMKLHFSTAAAKSREMCQSWGKTENVLSEIFAGNRPKSGFFVQNSMTEI